MRERRAESKGKENGNGEIERRWEPDRLLLTPPEASSGLSMHHVWMGIHFAVGATRRIGCWWPGRVR